MVTVPVHWSSTLEQVGQSVAPLLMACQSQAPSCHELMMKQWVCWFELTRRVALVTLVLGRLLRWRKLLVYLWSKSKEMLLAGPT